MKLVGLILALVVAAFLAASVWWEQRPRDQPTGTAPRDVNTHPATLDERISTGMQRAIRNASRVEAVLMSYSMSNPSDSEDQLVWLYKRRSEPLILSDKHRGAVASLLLERTSYLRDMSNTCEFMPDVAFRFESMAETTDVLVCHGCDEMVIWDGAERRWGNIHPARRQFEAISHTLFPDDSTVTVKWKEGLK